MSLRLSVAAEGLLLVLCAVSPTHARDREFPPETGPQWRPYFEWTLENATVDGNPFDLAAKAVFIHQRTGRAITTHLFPDGGNTWKFRFTGTLPGDWHFQTFSPDADLAGWTGTVDVKPNPGVRGFIKAFGQKWGWQGTEEAFIPQYLMAAKPRTFLTDSGSVDEAAIEAAIREFIDEHGFTGFHIAGGVANIWGNLLPEPSPGGGSRPYRIKDQIKTYSLFFAKRFVREMRTEYIGPELQLATPDRTHVIVYREDADQVRLDQSRATGPLKAIAVDTKVPYKEIDLGTIPAVAYTWKAPHRSDWAIAVGEF